MDTRKNIQIWTTPKLGNSGKHPTHRMRSTPSRINMWCSQTTAHPIIVYHEHCPLPRLTDSLFGRVLLEAADNLRDITIINETFQAINIKIWTAWKKPLTANDKTAKTAEVFYKIKRYIKRSWMKEVMFKTTINYIIPKHRHELVVQFTAVSNTIHSSWLSENLFYRSFSPTLITELQFKPISFIC